MPIERQNSIATTSITGEPSSVREKYDKYEEMSKVPSLFATSSNYNNFTLTSSSSSGSSSSSHTSKSNTHQPIIHLADLEFKDEKLRILKEAITFKGTFNF